MTGTMGKSLGGCRKKSCERNVGSNVFMEMQAAAEAGDISFGNSSGREWYTNPRRESVAVAQLTSCG